MAPCRNKFPFSMLEHHKVDSMVFPKLVTHPELGWLLAAHLLAPPGCVSGLDLEGA